MSDTVDLQRNQHVLAPSSLELIGVLKAHQAKIGGIVAERRPGHASGQLSALVDGVWSPTTIRAVRQLDANAVQLNGLWASLPPDWTCPCCRRPKSETIYPAAIEGNAPENGTAAIAHAVEHHDRFVSYVNHAFHRELGQDWSRHYPAASEVQRRLASGVVAFDAAVICEVCSIAEARARDVLWREMKLDQAFRDYFSFALDEIRSFIHAVPNAHHGIDEAAVIRCFEQRRKQEVMAFRRQEVDTQARLVKDGIHWHSAEPPAPDANAIHEAYELTLLEFGLEDGANFRFIDLCATGRNRQMDPDRWIEEPPKRRSFVFDREAEEFLRSDPMARELGRSWVCPCCRRSIRSAIRRNNKRALTLQPRTVKPDQGEPQLVCIDCHSAIIRLSTSAAVERDDVTFDDVRAAFAFASNEPHRVRQADLARQTVGRIKKRVEAATDRQLSVDFMPIEQNPRRGRRAVRPGGFY